ncbi:hypothetical protein E3N88_11510 [Mikania micrantha]|uniref:Uncharacterized protein n=1 Tax=Mikania micrantha TaxID=192012 RepID=A0A5N6PEP1_9ASTR|nr:hypothetical protein E3N88_25210 [Mikania micrantha]KAD6120239.1 hypothetical protein E3N88_11510 [Mikania micrantha]
MRRGGAGRWRSNNLGRWRRRPRQWRSNEEEETAIEPGFATRAVEEETATRAVEEGGGGGDQSPMGRGERVGLTGYTTEFFGFSFGFEK